MTNLKKEHVPVLDLSRFEHDKVDFVKEMGDAYKKYGFCVFTNHGIPQDVLKLAYDDFKTFFALPDAVKRKYVNQELPGVRGYTGFKVETAKNETYADLKEFWHIGRELSEDKPNPFPGILYPNVWPDEVPGFHKHGLVLYKSMESVGRKLMSALALNINLPADFFDPHLNYGNNILRALHYPPVKTSDLPAVRAAAHEDISMITILVGASSSGLELLTKEKNWLPVEAPEGSIIVNIGDMLQRLTNNVYPSTTHRVVNPVGEAANHSRYSLPFFYDVDPDYVIKTLESCITKDNPNRYPEPITANDYLMERLREIKMTGGK
jgi:isopenicillin N synthase-like dioxygenase